MKGREWLCDGDVTCCACDCVRWEGWMVGVRVCGGAAGRAVAIFALFSFFLRVLAFLVISFLFYVFV